MEVSIDQHQLTVTATDGYDVEPVQVTSVIVYPGESWDISATAEPGVSVEGHNYWVRAKTLETECNNSALAILRYPSAPDKDPESLPRECSATHRCMAVNCPFPAWPPNEHTDCLQVDQLKNADPNDTMPDPEALVDERFLNFVFEPSINNRRFVTPAAPPLTQPEEPL